MGCRSALIETLKIFITRRDEPPSVASLLEYILVAKSFLFNAPTAVKLLRDGLCVGHPFNFARDPYRIDRLLDIIVTPLSPRELEQVQMF